MPLQASITAPHYPLAPHVWNTPEQSFLECLQALAAELDLAMKAIAGNQLCTFEESVSRQLSLSLRLKTLAPSAVLGQSPAVLGQFPAVLGQSPAALPTKGEGATLDTRIDAALRDLQTLNQRYAALLKQSSETVKMLLHLLGASSGYIRGGDAPPANYSTWSCQL